MRRSFSEKRCLALACRDNGEGNRAHRVDDLSIRDMKRLLRVLTINLHGSCSHCQYWKCSHSNKCTEHYIWALPGHLRSHVGVFARTVLRNHAPTYRAKIGELCPVHIKLRPELMWDILGIFIESEDVIAAIIAELSAIPGSPFASNHLDKLAPLKVVAEASLMWTRDSRGMAGQEWKKKYPGARRRSQWAQQRDSCAACMLARTLESAELLSIVMVSIWIRNDNIKGTDNAPEYNANDHAWIRCCLEQVPTVKRMVVTSQAATLWTWINEQLLKTRQDHTVCYTSLSLNWDAYAKLVYLAQQAEMATLHTEFSHRVSAMSDLDNIHRQSASAPRTYLAGQMIPSDLTQTSQTLSSHFRIRRARAPTLRLPGIAELLPQDQCVYSPSIYSPLDLQSSFRHSRPLVYAALNFSSPERHTTDGDRTSVAHGTIPAAQLVTTLASSSPCPASLSDDADEIFINYYGRSTVFLDDDALDGQLTSRRRGDMWKQDGGSDPPPSLDGTWLMDDDMQPLLSKDKTGSVVIGVRHSSADIHTLPTLQPDDLDYSGISELGRRIDSLSGNIIDDMLARPPAYAGRRDSVIYGHGPLTGAMYEEM